MRCDSRSQSSPTSLLCCHPHNLDHGFRLEQAAAVGKRAPKIQFMASYQELMVGCFDSVQILLRKQMCDFPSRVRGPGPHFLTVYAEFVKSFGIQRL
ncbi:hypothetical protein NDU88_000602 [Pleurodeles waltl]|uniref:Uncharacterized protein n=1 Tax=Pleurodeles waltl TaxID=8319 RepID=A0AAV7V7E1_PLEWA|nr:hypothetical protein NDU88_000602 [Pleurodeles waltl]